MDIIRRAPAQFGHAAARWTLATIGATCPWLPIAAPSSVWHILDRLHLRWKRGKQHVHSPDPAYPAKQAYLQAIWHRVRTSEGREVLLFLDEMTLYQQPSVAHAWEAQGRLDPLAERSHQPDRAWRLLATLDAFTGQVVAWGRAHIRVGTLVAFYQAVRDAYPAADRIWVVQDNWPVHAHPEVRVALETQEAPWPLYLPPNWPHQPRPASVQRWAAHPLPLQIVPLPTYASWLNPIEKLWRWLRQQVVHQHRLAQDWPMLKATTLQFLAQFATPSPALLRYTGLAPD